MFPTSFFRRRLKNKLFNLLPPLVAALVRVWGRSCRRIRVVNGGFEENRVAAGRGCVYVTWHQRLFNIYFIRRPRRLSIMISRSRDGDLVAEVARRLGYESVRGSSSRGGSTAMTELVEKLRRRPGLGAGMLGDGPRGPARKLKPGAVRIAQLTGLPLLPVAYGARRAKLFASWDRFMLPLPFSPLVVIFGDPIWVPASTSTQVFEEIRRQVEDRLNELAEQCDACRRT
ncbi:MAG: lysophospholipid acyltransferase family protein [Deltaproteobacteria bacterium]|nr:lysophospholipid acyltransferase family protein [Deltaproteobacteria bacterium]